MTRGLNADIRDLIVQDQNLDSFHGGCRLPPGQLMNYWSIDQTLCAREPTVVAVFDDMLTTGSHFKAAKMLIRGQWPYVPVFGVFLARVCRPPVGDLSGFVF
jgi:hypothetical protein